MYHSWYMKQNTCWAALTRSGGNLLVGVLAEDVPDDHNSLLDHIVDLGLDQIQKGADTALSRLLKKVASVDKSKEKTHLLK